MAKRPRLPSDLTDQTSVDPVTDPGLNQEPTRIFDSNKHAPIKRKPADMRPAEMRENQPTRIVEMATVIAPMPDMSGASMEMDPATDPQVVLTPEMRRHRPVTDDDEAPGVTNPDMRRFQPFPDEPTNIASPELAAALNRPPEMPESPFPQVPLESTDEGRALAAVTNPVGRPYHDPAIDLRSTMPMIPKDGTKIGVLPSAAQTRSRPDSRAPIPQERPGTASVPPPMSQFGQTSYGSAPLAPELPQRDIPSGPLDAPGPPPPAPPVMPGASARAPSSPAAVSSAEMPAAETMIAGRVPRRLEIYTPTSMHAMSDPDEIGAPLQVKPAPLPPTEPPTPAPKPAKRIDPWKSVKGDQLPPAARAVALGAAVLDPPSDGQGDEEEPETRQSGRRSQPGKLAKSGKQKHVATDPIPKRAREAKPASNLRIVWILLGLFAAGGGAATAIWFLSQ